MDTDLEINDPAHRKISNHLYISDLEQRLLQEIVLGIGGSAVLAKLGIKHSAVHLNEGHPAFALLERIRERVEDGMPYAEAVERVRVTSIFTTHTPVPAGHDVFPFDLIDKYICHCLPSVGSEPGGLLQIGDLTHRSSGRRVQHDRLCLAAVRLPQRRQPEARGGLAPHVAAPLAGNAGGSGPY